jgi:hypothetical protein
MGLISHEHVSIAPGTPAEDGHVIIESNQSEMKK